MAVPAWASGPLDEYCFDGAAPQRASADDMHIFDSYIGKFRGATQRDDASGREHYFTVEYSWFGASHQIVRFRVAMSVIGEATDRTLNEGYYGFDPFNERIYVLAVFPSGASGFGAVGEFDRTTDRKSTWACQAGAAGEITYVRDVIEPVDANSWRIAAAAGSRVRKSR